MLRPPLVLRRPLPGDRFDPLGMEGKHQKLTDYLRIRGIKGLMKSEAWVVEDEGRLLAVLVLEDFPDSLQLDNIAIAPAALGKGLGRALVSFTEDEARRRGYSKVTLYTNEKMAENLTLYPRLGFVARRRGWPIHRWQG